MDRDFDIMLLVYSEMFFFIYANSQNEKEVMSNEELSKEEDSISSRDSTNEEEMDSVIPCRPSNCHQILLDFPRQNLMENEELSSNIDDVLSDDGTFENIVEYAVLLPDSFVVLD